MRRDRASATAALVALSAVVLSRQPRERELLAVDSARRSEQLLQVAAPTPLRLVRAVAARPLRGLVRGPERAVLPGI